MTTGVGKYFEAIGRNSITTFNPDHHQWELLADKAFAASKNAFDQALGDDSPYAEEKYETAVQYAEQLAAPVLQYIHGIDEQPAIALDDWADQASNDFDEELCQIPFTSGFKINMKSPEYSDFYDELANQFAPDEFDYLFGVYSSGIPVLYTASAYLEGDPVVVKYSHLRDDDTSVSGPDWLLEQEDLTGTDIAVLDDTVSSQETLRSVADYLEDYNPRSVTGIVMRDEREDIPAEPNTSSLTVVDQDDLL